MRLGVVLPQALAVLDLQVPLPPRVAPLVVGPLPLDSAHSDPVAEVRPLGVAEGTGPHHKLAKVLLLP